MLIMKEKKPKSASKKTILKQEDIEIWQIATKDVLNLDHSNHITAETNPNRRHQKLKAISGKIDLETIKPVHHHQSPSSFQMDGALRKKFEAGELEIEGKIDLHGLTLAEAHHQFTRFMSQMIKNGSRFLLVVTGKGNGTGKGVIRQNLPKWCEELPLKTHILSIKSAKAKHGGDGANYILLRRQKN
jgi:DNA-nicking Smr family endonuclease